MKKNEIIAAIVELNPNTDAETLDKLTVPQLKKVLKEEQSNIKSFGFREMLQKADQAAESVVLAYEWIMNTVQQQGISWEEMPEFIMDKEFQDWPTKSLKDGSVKRMGIQAAMRENYEPAKWFNRFNVYRNKYSDFGVLKADSKQVAEDVEEEETEGVGSGTKEQGKAIVVNLAAIPAFIEFLAKDAATRKNKAEKDSLLIVVEDLKTLYNIG